MTLDPSVSIDPTPTGAGGIVLGTTIAVKGTAKCIKETFDTAHPDDTPTEDSPESIMEVAVRLGPSGAFVKANPIGPVSGHHRFDNRWRHDTGGDSIDGERQRQTAGRFRAGVFESEMLWGECA